MIATKDLTPSPPLHRVLSRYRVFSRLCSLSLFICFYALSSQGGAQLERLGDASTSSSLFSITLRLNAPELWGQPTPTKMPSSDEKKTKLKEASPLTEFEVEEWFSHYEGRSFYGLFRGEVWVGESTKTVSRVQSGDRTLIQVQVDDQFKIDAQKEPNTQPKRANNRDIKRYLSTAPFKLISATYMTYHDAPKGENSCDDGAWCILNEEGGLNRLTLTSQETLRAQIGLSPALLIGYGWTYPQFDRGVDYPIETRVIDHRFERRGGRWAPMIELSTVDRQRAQSKTEVIDRFKLRWSIQRSDGLSQYRMTRRAIEKRQLPLWKMPTLIEIQRQRGTLSSDALNRVLSRKREALDSCFLTYKSTHKTDVTPSVVVRLDIDQRGRLRSVGAVEIEHPNLTACLLSALRGLQFSPPNQGAATLAYPISFTP